MTDLRQRGELMMWCVAWLRTRGYPDINFAENALDTQWANDQVEYIRSGAHQAEFIDKWGSLDNAVRVFADCYLNALALVRDVCITSADQC